MKCPCCGRATLISDTSDLPYTYKRESILIKNVNGLFCSSCGEGFFDAEESKEISTKMLEFNKLKNMGNLEQKLKNSVWINSERMRGSPCFYGTRVQIKNLFDYLEGGESIDDFLEDFEGVTREQVTTVIALAGDTFIEYLILQSKLLTS